MKCKDLVLVENIYKAYFDKDPLRIVGVYYYGSIMYGTDSETSDYDYVVICDMVKNDYLHYESSDLDIHYISINHYKELLKQHDIMALECFYNPTPILKYDNIDFELSLPSLRKSISAVTNNSWVKAKKKMTLENEDNYIGAKSLFHVMRIIQFGIQIAETHNIDFTRYSDLLTLSEYFNIVMGTMKDLEYNWYEIRNIFKPEYNRAMTKFRKLAPKNEKK